jgi:hypothetical protein
MRVGNGTRLAHAGLVVREMHYSSKKMPGRRCEQEGYGLCANGETPQIVTNVLFRVMDGTVTLMTAGETTGRSFATGVTRNKL